MLFEKSFSILGPIISALINYHILANPLYQHVSVVLTVSTLSNLTDHYEFI